MEQVSQHQVYYIKELLQRVASLELKVKELEERKADRKGRKRVS